MYHCKVCNLDLSRIVFHSEVSPMHISRVQKYDLEVVHYPENTEVEDLTALDVLKVADMTIKLVDELKVRLSREEMDR